MMFERKTNHLIAFPPPPPRPPPRPRKSCKSPSASFTTKMTPATIQGISLFPQNTTTTVTTHETTMSPTFDDSNQEDRHPAALTWKDLNENEEEEEQDENDDQKQWERFMKSDTASSSSSTAKYWEWCYGSSTAAEITATATPSSVVVSAPERRMTSVVVSLPLKSWYVSGCSDMDT